MTETEDYDKSAAAAAHKTSHQDGGSDEISVLGLSGLLGDSQTPLAHKTSHQDTGTDEISVSGLSGELTDEQKSAWAKVSGKPSTFTPEAHADHHQDGGADEIGVTGLSGLLADDQHVKDDEVLAYLQTLPKFSAHKNGTDQGEVKADTFTKVTFTTEEYDVGSAYDAANSKWVPGIIGKASIKAAVMWQTSSDQMSMEAIIYKNGVSYKKGMVRGSGTGALYSCINIDIPISLVTDYIEIYVYQSTGSDKTIIGAIDWTYFMGHMLP